MKKKSWIVAGAISVALLCLCAGVLAGADSPELAGCTRGWELAELGIFIGASLPVEAIDTHFVIKRGADRVAYLRFRVPPAVLDEFLHQQLGLFHRPLRQSYNPFSGRIGQEIDWWRPGEAQSYVGGDSYTGARNYQLLVDQADPELWTVYLRVANRS